MESSLRAFFVLMLLLAAGVAGVGSSTRPATTRLTTRWPTGRPALAEFHVVCGPEQHFVFVTPLRHAATIAPASHPTVLHQRGPRPVQVHSAEALPAARCDEGKDEDSKAVYDAGTKPSQADSLAQRHSLWHVDPHDHHDRGLQKMQLVPSRIAFSLYLNALTPNAPAGQARLLHALSYDFAETWETDRDQRQVALLHSLCGLPASSTSTHLQHKKRHFSGTHGHGLVPPRMAWPEASRSTIGLKHTCKQFCNWFQHWYLRRDTASQSAAEETAAQVVLTPDEYAQPIESIAACLSTTAPSARAAPAPAAVSNASNASAGMATATVPSSHGSGDPSPHE